MSAPRSMILLLGAATVLAVSAHAHHSQSMFVETPTWVKGTVVRYRPTDPHVMIELEEKQPGGAVRRWIVEGPNMNRLARILRDNGNMAARDFFKAGDRISVCGFGLKRDFAGGGYPDWPADEGRFVHGQVLVMPDGRMLSWGPYGQIDHCVREGDQAASWSAFLDRDPRAHDQWCAARASSRSTVLTPQPFIDEVVRGMKSACR